MTKTTSAWLLEATQRLQAAGIADSRLDARLLLQHLLGIEHAAMISRDAQQLQDDIGERYLELIARRAGGEPVSRIIGYRHFHGLKFEVTPDVLDPRPDTELLVERSLLAARQLGNRVRILDVGTGSGAIAIALLHELPNAICHACDISSTALVVAANNARLNSVGERFVPVHSNLFSAIEGVFDLIVSNPPYIETNTISRLERDVRDHDPLLALDGGADGLDFYRNILRSAQNHLAPGGILLLECGAGQAYPIDGLAQRAGWTVRGRWRDLGGVERVIEMHRA